jgi:hypothetical protein
LRLRLGRPNYPWDTEGTCNGCSGGWRVITHAAMATPMSTSSKSTVAIMSTVVGILAIGPLRVMRWPLAAKRERRLKIMS